MGASDQEHQSDRTRRGLVLIAAALAGALAFARISDALAPPAAKSASNDPLVALVETISGPGAARLSVSQKPDGGRTFFALVDANAGDTSAMTEAVETIISGAAGFDAAAGDVLDVRVLPFAQSTLGVDRAALAEAAGLAALTGLLVWIGFGRREPSIKSEPMIQAARAPELLDAEPINPALERAAQDISNDPAAARAGDPKLDARGRQPMNTDLVLTSDAGVSEGVERSARLLKAMGARAGAVWSELSRDEAAKLNAAIDQLDVDAGRDTRAAQAYLLAEAETHANGPDQTEVWRRASNLDAAALASLLATESPHVAGLMLSRIDPAAAARALRLVPSPHAIATLRSLLALSPPQPRALEALENALAKTLDALDADAAGPAPERVARIFDQLDSRSEATFLAALDNAEPGAGGRVRQLMFTFDDVAGLDAAGLQTLLASVDRSRLALALKAAKPRTLDAFFSNMTARAREVLKEEMAGLGAVRRSDVERARGELAAAARRLIEAGEIRPSDVDTDELVE